MIYVHSMNPSVGHMRRLADIFIIIKSVSLVKYRPTNLSGPMLILKKVFRWNNLEQNCLISFKIPVKILRGTSVC